MIHILKGTKQQTCSSMPGNLSLQQRLYSSLKFTGTALLQLNAAMAVLMATSA
jgi:hypothetical protein